MEKPEILSGHCTPVRWECQPQKNVLLPTQEMGGQKNWIMERMDSFQMLTCQGVWKRNSHGPAMRC